MEDVQINLQERNLKSQRKKLDPHGFTARLHDGEVANPAGFPVDLPDTKNLTPEERAKLIREIRAAQS